MVGSVTIDKDLQHATIILTGRYKSGAPVDVAIPFVRIDGQWYFARKPVVFTLVPESDYPRWNPSSTQ